MTFKLPPLPFDAAALAPHISTDTMNTHHGKHHAAYVKKMNAALAEMSNPPETVEDVVRLAAREENQKLFNNAAQAWNHAFFWECLTPPDDFAEPSGKLADALNAAFSSLKNFKDEFVARGEGHFASGWVWLVADKAGKLELRDLHDAQTPIVQTNVTPILVCDVWEHAYYLDHKNERGVFLKAFVNNLIDWRFAETQYAAARGEGEAWRYPS